MPASASAATSFGWVLGSSLTQARAEVSRYSAMPPSCESPGNELSVQCMSSPARQARHTPQVADGQVGHGRAHLVYPACVLVAERVRQGRLHGRVPLALDDVQVGAADTG